MSKKHRSGPKMPAAPILYPAVIQNPPAFAFEAEAISSLEKAGGITLSSELVRKLTHLAENWLLQERIVQSARPSDFRARIQQLQKNLKGTADLPDLNEPDAASSDHHFLNWAINVPGASEFYNALDNARYETERLRRMLAALEATLPIESGRGRKRDDMPLMMRLVDLYEAAGGTAMIYYSGPASRTSDTAFRRFADEFYRQLPLRQARADTGFHTALAQAIRQKRATSGKLERDKDGKLDHK